MTADPAKHNGLVTWRKRQAESKRERMAELASYREQATMEIRDGRQFRVLHIPDRYDEERPAA